MAATRKLQGEIERCLKKVTEGVETFEDIWQKVHNATNSNQKEKYEADLKKEIKKLQRLRDQIKSWIASGEIKDKTTLVDYRRLIETQMERFKVVERETKTKAYSKEGLGAAQKMDPAQKEREEISTWLVSSIDTLNLQTDQFESEIESLLAGKKKRLDKDKQDRMDELKLKLEKHRYHIRKLETLLRMLDNMSVEVGQIRGIKEDVEYYIESSQEPDFEGNEYIYDDIIGMDEIELSGVGVAASSVTTDSNGSPTSLMSTSPPATSPTNMVTANNHSADHTPAPPDKPGGGSTTISSTHQQPPHKTVVKPMAVRASSAKGSPNSKTSGGSLPGSGISNSVTSSLSGCISPQPMSSTPMSTSVPGSGIVSANFAAVAAAPPANHHKHNNHIVENGVGGGSSSSSSSGSASVSSNSSVGSNSGSSNGGGGVLVSNSGISSMVTSGSVTGVTTAMTSGSGSIVGGPVQASTPVPGAGDVPSPPSSSVGSSPAPPPLSPPPSSTSQHHHHHHHHLHQHPHHHHHHQLHQANSTTTSSSIVGSAGMHSSVSLSVAASSQQPVTSTTSAPTHHHDHSISLKSIAQQAIDRAGLEMPPTSQSSRVGTNCGTSGGGSSVSESIGGSGCQGEANIPPLLGVAPLGPVPLMKEHQLQFEAMEAAYYHMPHPSDSERVRPYLPRTPTHTPPYYQQVPLPHSDTVEFFQRLSTETLFFIFYYMEGSKAQYLAAKALKKQSWRFHTKYMMWFQRHEEPKLINEEYEQGTYIYFDYEKWGQRKKEGFTFEYKYLEDRDLN